MLLKLQHVILSGHVGIAATDDMKDVNILRRHADVNYSHLFLAGVLHARTIFVFSRCCYIVSLYLSYTQVVLS